MVTPSSPGTSERLKERKKERGVEEGSRGGYYGNHVLSSAVPQTVLPEPCTCRDNQHQCVCV